MKISLAQCLAYVFLASWLARSIWVVLNKEGLRTRPWGTHHVGTQSNVLGNNLKSSGKLANFSIKDRVWKTAVVKCSSQFVRRTIYHPTTVTAIKSKLFQRIILKKRTTMALTFFGKPRGRETCSFSSTLYWCLCAFWSDIYAERPILRKRELL